MEKSNLNILIPATRNKITDLLGNGDVVLNARKTWELEQVIPIDDLLEETRQLEEALAQRNKSSGYMSGVDDLDDSDGADFAHVLEHAVLAIVDSHLQPGQLSIGATRNDGIIPERTKVIGANRIPHGREIHFSLAPAIPPRLQQEYIDSIIEQLVMQSNKKGKIKLTKIVL